MARKRRSNDLSTEDLSKIRGVMRADYLDFDDALRIFMRDCETRNLRSHTQTYYRNELTTFRKILDDQGVTTLPGEITKDDINEHLIRYSINKGIKITSINTRLRAVRAFFNFLFTNHYIADNPVKDLSLVRDRKTVITTFSTRQLADILNAPDLKTFTGNRDYTIMMLMLETGIRVNELIGIDVTDIYWDESKILIRKTKNHMQRFVPVTSTMKQQLKRYISLRGTIVDCNALFVTVDDTPLSKRQVQNRISKYGKIAGIENVRCSPHTFRHTFAKFSVKNGAGIFELQQVLGHTTMDMVKNYVNLFAEDVVDSHRKFSPLNNIKGRL